MNWKLTLTLTAAALLFTLSCRAASPIPPQTNTLPTLPPTTQTETQPEPEPVITPSVPPTVYPLTVTDDLGRKVVIEKSPRRIVSLAPSNTEILFALGLDDRIIGVTDYCDYPEAAKSKPRVSSYTMPNMEKLISLEPDLIVAESIQEKMVLPALEKLSFTVVVLKAVSVDAVLNDIKMLGQITDRNEASLKLVDDLTAKIDAISSKTINLPPENRPRVLYVVWYQPIWTMGGKTYVNDLIEAAGGINIYADAFEASRTVSLESVFSANPQIIIVSGMGTGGDATYNSIKGEERLKPVDAIVNKRLYKLSDSNLVERAGPRIVMGLQELASLIHPEIFGAIK